MGHVIAFLLGTVTGAVLVTVARWNLERREMDEMPQPTWRATFIAGAFFISLALVGFGVQQGLYQSQQRDYDQCVSNWGNTVVETLDQRVRKTRTTIESAQRDVYQKAADLLDVLAQITTRPPEAGQRDLLRARIAYAEAGARYAEAERQLSEFRTANPYPALDC